MSTQVKNGSCKIERQTKLILIFFGFAILPYAKAAQPNILWNIGGTGLFDTTNKVYPIKDGGVTVPIGQGGVCCPTGLGHLVSGRASVKEITFLFETEQSDDYWLCISWNPGGSGKEQFEVFCNGATVGKSRLVDAQRKPNQQIEEQFDVNLAEGQNNITLRHFSGDGLRFQNIVLSRSKELPPPLNPTLKFPTLTSYESECGVAGIMLDSPCVRLFAPKRKAKQARIILKYLVRAYEQLYRLVGMHTDYKIVIYHFPENSEYAFGGTSNCTIWYSYKSLDIDSQKEWKKHKKPHICGYIEEMAHNFVHASRAQFGWEMIGWTIGTKVTKKVAGNPIHTKSVRATQDKQKETFRRYREGGYIFPRDLPANQCDRIHAYILGVCEEKYGQNFWPDFFGQIRKEHQRLIDAVALGDSDKIRNERYRITIECFDRLERLNFKQTLKKLQISLTTDVKSLHPEEAGWNRKFIR